jgi:peptide/nickel transport system permease protein
MIVILIGAAVVIFTILYFTPGDPAERLLGNDATEAEIKVLRNSMGLDDPYVIQLGQFLVNTFIKFDFGKSWTYGTPVLKELLNRLPRTIGIGLAAMLIEVLLGIPLGVYAATHQGKWQDSLAMIVAMLLISLPDFWLALMMIVLFSLKLGWLPSYGIGSILHYVMPVICCAAGVIAVNARQTRSSMLEVFRADFITTARAKGQEEKIVVRKHMLPNALLPIITQVGNGFTRVVAGSAIIESVFSIPGVGLYLLNGISSRDYPIVRGCVLFLAAFTAVSMLLVDLCYAYTDPRIRAQYSGGRRIA